MDLKGIGMGRNWITGIVIFFISLKMICSQDVTYHIDEQLPNSTFIGNIGEQSNLFSAVGETDSSTFIYSFLSTGNPYAQLFRVEETTSDLYTNDVIDREQVCMFSDSCMLVVQVAAKSTLGSFFRILKVHIFVDDVNDHAPVFNRSGLTQGISEAVLVGTSISIDGARDLDTSQEYSLKSYELESTDLNPPKELPFSIQFVKHLDGSSVIKLFVTAPLDREITPMYRLEIIAKDGDSPPRIGRLPVVIIVTDVNDNAPEFTAQSYDVAINEEAVIGSVIAVLEARDKDDGENGMVKYRLSPHQSQEIFKYFELNENNGEIIVKEPIIYSPGKFFKIIAEAYDNPDSTGKPGEGQQLSTQTFVTVTVENSGNNPPEIRINLITNSDEPADDEDTAIVSEFANIGHVVAHLTVVDHDVGKQGVTNCIIESIDFNLQRMGVNEYTVVLSQKLDYERSKRQNVTVHCQDSGTPPLHASHTFTVLVKDANDHAPIFTKAFYTKNLSEDSPIGEYILEVSATDMDTIENARVHFKVADKFRKMFYFENSDRTPNTGYLRLNASLDRETKSSYVFAVKAVDSGKPPKTGIATINLHITDVNDEKPVFIESPFNFTVPENLPADSEVDRVVATDHDLGMNAQVEYKMDPEYVGKVPFVVFADGIVKTNQELDREELNHYEFNVIAIDKGQTPLSSTGKVKITVKDTNDKDPDIIFPRYPNNTVVVRPVINAWDVVARVLAYDEDQVDTGNSRLKYSIENRNDSKLFQINPNTGEIQATTDLVERDLGKVYRLDILVSDYGFPAQRSAISPLIIKISLHNATLEPYSDREESLSNQNFLIAVIVGIVTVVLAIGILATICIIQKIDRQRKAEQKKEAAKNEFDMVPKFDGSITVFSLPSEDSLLNEKKKKEVSFSLEDDVFSDDDLIQKNGIALDHHHRHFRPNLTYLAPSPNNKKVEDNHSETSGDTGTSDSGRGGSDEEIHTSMSQSPRDKMMDMSRSIPPLSHQEIIPFSFKKGMTVPYRGDHVDYRNNKNDLEMSRREMDMHRNGMTGMSTVAVHLHNNSLERSQNKVVLLQTDSGIHSDTNSNEGEMIRDYMV